MGHWTIRKTVKAVSVGFAVYFAIASYLKYTYVPLPPKQFANYGSTNIAFIAKNLAPDELADSPDDLTRSPVMLLEDGKELGPAHSAHEEIRDLGHGRFSHWRGTGIIFSASDNTDPNTNGRKYTISTPPPKQFAPFGTSNRAFIAKNLAPDELADSPDNPPRSPVMLLEDGKELGPAHSAHEQIRDLGRGRFSHWRGIGIIFSTSDNTDPNTNGRKYTVKERH